jgi:hypothetical protein
VGTGLGAGRDGMMGFDMLTDKNNRRKVLSDVRLEWYSEVF